jgi:7,8-dihydropterin-6-yl-methyl-4-(beta-D-ribofuranosyl)aminobenzene 5'-phosphate synthase
MDAGTSTIALLHNAHTLGLNLEEEVDDFFLSHGHFDHFASLPAFLSKARRGVTIHLHPDVFLERRINLAIFGLPDKIDLPQLDEDDLVRAGAAIEKTKSAITIASGLVMATGDAERVTEFERGFPLAEAKIDGNWVVDPFHDDQGLVVKVRGKGLVIIGGCSHAGIINTVRHAQRVTGTDKVHAVMGGFHLTGAMFEPVIKPTITEMKRLEPDFVVPMHCTGWKAIKQFAEEMPQQFLLNTVGTTYMFQ